MKKYFFLALMSATLSTAAVAQSEPQSQSQGQTHSKHDRAEWDKKIKEELKLTAEQITSYDAISKEYDDKIDALMSNSTLDKEALKQQKMQLKAEKVSRINQILTPEQQTRYKELLDKKKSESEKSTPASGTGTGTSGGTGSGS